MTFPISRANRQVVLLGLDLNVESLNPTDYGLRDYIRDSRNGVKLKAIAAFHGLLSLFHAFPVRGLPSPFAPSHVVLFPVVLVLALFALSPAVHVPFVPLALALFPSAFLVHVPLLEQWLLPDALLRVLFVHAGWDPALMLHSESLNTSGKHRASLRVDIRRHGDVKDERRQLSTIENVDPSTFVRYKAADWQDSRRHLEDESVK